MKFHLPSNKVVVGMISVLIAIAVLLTIAPAAYAEGSGPLTAIPGLGRLPNETLIRMHKKEGTWFNDQEGLLRDAGQLSSTFQKLIDAEVKNKKNVTDLNDALATFESELTACKEIHALAGTIIFSLPGWKVNGDVRDRLAAGQSLLDGRESLRDANFRLNNAMAVLRKSFVIWRAQYIHGIPLAHPNTPEP